MRNSFPVIASQRVGAKRRPMTGSAQQSMSPHGDIMDCFGATLLAMTEEFSTASFRGDAKASNPESRDSPMCSAHLRSGPSDHPGMTAMREHPGFTGDTTRLPFVFLEIAIVFGWRRADCAAKP